MFRAVFYAFLFVPFIISGCNSDKKEEFVLTLAEEEIDRTRGMLRQLNQDMAFGQVFNSQPDETRALIEVAVERSIAAMNILKTSNNDLSRIELAYNELSSAMYLVETGRLLEVNEEETFEIFNQLGLIQVTLARSLGRDEFETVLYRYNFGDGIEPDFRAPFGKDKFGDISWATNFQIDLPKAKISGRNGYAWMISKAFDISDVTNPQFRFHSALLVSSRDAELTLFEVIERVFKVFIILDMNPNEVIEEIPDERKIRVEYKPSEVPLARDFHDRWLPWRSLENYKDHKVSIGFLFDTREIEYKQFYSWDIFDFEISGAGKIGIEPFFSKPYLPEKLGGFQSLTQVFAGPEWLSGRDGVYINSVPGEKTDSVLMSPFYTTEAIPFQSFRRLRLVIEEELSVDDMSQAQVIVSTDYRAGLPFDMEDQNWVILERIGEGPQQAFDLTEYQDDDLVIAFRFRSEKENENWDINSFILVGEGQRLFPLPFVSQDSNDSVDIFGTYDFIEDRLRDYIRIAEEDAPEWKKRTSGVNISAHKGGGEPPFSGGSRLIGKAVDISNNPKNVVRIRHTVGFIKGRGPLKVEVRLACVEEDQASCEPWEEVAFPDSVLNARIDDMTTSNWIELDEKYSGQSVEFSFYYKSDGNNTPNWTIEYLEVATGREE